MELEYLNANNQFRAFNIDNVSEWYITLSLGYEPLGSLQIYTSDFDGRYPPVKNIINFKEVIEYLKSKHMDKLNKRLHIYKI